MQFLIVFLSRLKFKSVSLRTAILFGLFAVSFLLENCPRSCPSGQPQGPSYRSNGLVNPRKGCHYGRRDPDQDFATHFTVSCLCSNCTVNFREFPMSKAALPANGRVHHGYYPSLELLASNCSSRNRTVVQRHCEGGPVILKMSLQEDVRSLTMNTNCISDFSRHYFCNLSSLESLNLSCNKLRDSEQLGFGTSCGENCRSHSPTGNSTGHLAPQSHNQCACNLRHLDLQYNHLTTIKRGVFCAFVKLTSLNLSVNDLDGVDQGALDGLGNLESLDLSWNVLKQLPGDLFDSVTKLSTLFLFRNHLSEASAVNLSRLSDLKVLRLDGNRFGSIPVGFFKGLNSLQTLSLAKNGINELTDEFQFLEGLTALDLSSNRLQSLAESAFDPLVNLTTLALSDNGDLPSGNLSLAENTRLTTLSLSRCGLQAMPKIGGLARLTSLDLSQNSIEELSDDDKRLFSSLSAISWLDLSRNKIRTISPGMFDENMSMKKVELRNNQIANIAGVFENSRMETLILSNNLLVNFSFDNVSPHLLELSLGRNMISVIVSPASISDLKLHTLHLPRNQLSVLDSLKIPGNLRRLDLERNWITRLSFARYHPNQSAPIPAQTEYINLRRNQLQSVCLPILYLKHYQVAPKFDVSVNPLMCACEWKFRHPKLKVGPIQDCLQFGRMRPCSCAYEMHGFMDAPGGSDELTCLTSDKQSPDCQCNLYKGYSGMCGLPCPENCSCRISGHFNQHYIDCKNRSLLVVPVMSDTGFATNVSFSHNDIRTISRSELRPLSGAIGLNFDHNLLQTIARDTFLDLTELLELGLGHNRLSFLDLKVFLPLIALQELRLDSNLLTEFPVWELPCQNNSCRLALGGNPWSCECSYVEPFRSWLKDAVSRLTDADTLHCASSNDTLAASSMIFFNSSYCYREESRVVTLTDVTMMASLLVSLLLLATTAVLAFVYRREMQKIDDKGRLVLLYSRYGIRLFPLANEGDENMIFDAFVAYSSVDEEFVCCNLVPKLEGIENPYKLCVHHRDFVVGEYITENIHQAVNSSRRTIVVLSDSFVTSEWCHLEFEAAHQKMLTDRCNRVIMIVLGELTEELDFDMKLYMKTNTYVKWGDHLFWEKLYFAMPDRKLVN